MNDDGATLGKRLRLERTRRKLSGAEFAAAVGVTERAQRNYEADARLPGAAYLAAAHAAGVDIEFVLSGSKRSVRVLSESAQASAVVWAVEAVEDACAAAGVSLTTYKKARLVAVVHRLHVAGTSATREHLLSLIELAAGSDQVAPAGSAPA